MIIVTPTELQKEQLNNSIQAAMEAIENYKETQDGFHLKESLCKIVDEMPNLSYLDPDVLSCYGIEEDDNQWVECSKDELDESKKMLKEYINDIQQFQTHQLSFVSSGSILRTLFGDAYDEIG